MVVGIPGTRGAGVTGGCVLVCVHDFHWVARKCETPSRTGLMLSVTWKGATLRLRFGTLTQVNSAWSL